MGLRLYSEFHSSTNKLFKVEIYDSSYGGTAQDFVIASDGFTLNYSGETDDIVSPIISSNCTVSAYNEDAFFDNFVTDLKQYQEKRFTLRVLLHNGTNYAHYWAGIIMQDLITVEDTSKPFVFQITAVDGIGSLANIPYESVANVTIESFIESAVGAIGLDELYLSNDNFYSTVVNVWDTQHTYSAITDVTTLTRFSALVYSEKQEDGTVTYSNYLDILKELCIAFGARFYQKDGVFTFEQYLERVEAERVVYTYLFDGSLDSTATVNDDVTLDGTTGGGARLAGNQFNFLPALKKVQVGYNQSRANNLLANRLTFTGATGRQDLGFVVDDNNGKIQVTGQLIYELNHNGNAGTVVLEFWRPVWRLELRIEDAANPGTFYYLKRDWSPSGGQLYGATSWTTTASYYHIDAGIGKNDSSGAYISNSFSLVTPPLPVDGDAELDVNYYQAYDLNNTVQTIPVYFDETNQVKEVTATYLNDSGASSQVTIYSATNTDANINSNLILDLGELRVSDSLGLQGSFYVYDGSAWVASTQWRRGNTGSYTSLLKLLTNEVLSLHKKPIERYSGTIVGPYSFGIRYEFDSAYWLPMSGSYNANMDEWSSEWFKITKDATDITVDNPVGTGGGADFVARVSSQQGTDEVINVLDINTTDATVSNDATIGNDLTVSGGSTLAATSVTNFNHSGNLIENITEVSHSPGSTYNITDSEYMIFNKWQAGAANGTATINLPPAGDYEGRLIRFKSDGSISATNEILLQPDGGETIDGEASYSFNRDYDGLMLLAYRSAWYIIQRKSK